MIFEYQIILTKLDEFEKHGIIGAFDKRTIIELSNDVIKAIAQKYDNVQESMGDIMGGALLETDARTILNQGIERGIEQGIKETAAKMLKSGKLSVAEIADYTGLTISEISQLNTD